MTDERRRNIENDVEATHIIRRNAWIAPEQTRQQGYGRHVPPPGSVELTQPLHRISPEIGPPELADLPTTVLPRVAERDEPKETEDPVATRPRGSSALRAIGELCITAGLVLLLFVVYEVYVTDWLSAGKQADATVELNQRWNIPANNGEPQRPLEPIDGQGFAKIYIPAFGSDYRYTVLEGTSEQTLAVGPGHYKGTAYPGEPGNFAVAGHRVGKGAPFNDLDLLASCDAIVVETRTSWFIYRMLPTQEERANWAATKGRDSRCAGVPGLVQETGPYAQTVGREIVRPQQGEVIAPVPHQPEVTVPREKQARLITLTTCHPRFSARQRLIVHGVLVRTEAKDAARPNAVPAEFQTG